MQMTEEIMTHFEEMLAQHDKETARILSIQVRNEQAESFGAFVEENGFIDTRHCGSLLAHLCVAYLVPQSGYYLSDTVKNALSAAFSYLLGHQRPGGCLDLVSCNFASAPDTAFTMNAVINAWLLLEKREEADTAWLRPLMRQLLESCCEGVMNGGFHTPNHRWAISACLKHAARICGREDFSRKADVYLGEGLDIDENGEFAERSTGTYNAVNDDQMLRLFLATGDRTYLEAARSNLYMMLSYIDPDGSVFTYNSTRQDYGQKVYPDNYYSLYLLAGYLAGDEELAAYSEYCYASAAAHGRVPRGLEWLALYPDLEAFGKRRKPDLSRIEQGKRLFQKSGIGRMRWSNASCTVMAGKPNFLYFQNGENVVYLVLYGNVCEKRNFVPQAIEETERGFRVSARMDSWYYLPFEGDGPATQDWWAMDNANTRKKLISDSLSITADVERSGDGVDVRIAAQGLSGVPIRLEWGVLPGCKLRNENFLMDAVPGGSMTVCAGHVQAVNAKGDCISLSPAFAKHNVLFRMGGAYPLSNQHFTLFFTAASPFEQLIHIGTKPVFDRIL